MVIGVTGGIATGKTTAIRCFEKLGANVVDADVIARKLMAPGTSLALSVIERFGSEYSVSNEPATIDRAKLGSAVFHTPALRKTLEEIVHPQIIRSLLFEIDRLRSSSPRSIIAAEVPLLYEATLQKHFDRVLVVWCEEQTQRARLRDRMPQLSENMISERIHAQISLETKRAAADFQLSSDQPLFDMEAELVSLYENLRHSS